MANAIIPKMLYISILNIVQNCTMLDLMDLSIYRVQILYFKDNDLYKDKYLVKGVGLSILLKII